MAGSGWPVRPTLKCLEIPPASYYCWRREVAWEQPRSRSPAGSLYELLESERQAIIDYALKHLEIRHRELAWRMLDEGVCSASSSSVYRVLRDANLVCADKSRQAFETAQNQNYGRKEKLTISRAICRIGVTLAELSGASNVLKTTISLILSGRRLLLWLRTPSVNDTNFMISRVNPR